MSLEDDSTDDSIEESSGGSSLIGAAVCLGSLAAVTLVAIAVVQGFADTTLVDAEISGQFVTILSVFATFAAVVALALVGKIIVNAFRGPIDYTEDDEDEESAEEFEAAKKRFIEREVVVSEPLRKKLDGIEHDYSESLKGLDDDMEV